LKGRNIIIQKGYFLCNALSGLKISFIFNPGRCPGWYVTPFQGLKISFIFNPGRCPGLVFYALLGHKICITIFDITIIKTLPVMDYLPFQNIPHQTLIKIFLDNIENLYLPPEIKGECPISL